MRSVVDKVIPSIVNLTSAGKTVRDSESGVVDPQMLLHEHVRSTVSLLYGTSASITKAVDEGRCAIVGLEYELTEGRVRLVESIGDIGE